MTLLCLIAQWWNGVILCLSRLPECTPPGVVPAVSSGPGDNDAPCNTSPGLVGDANNGEVVSLKLLLKCKLMVGSYVGKAEENRIP